MSGPAVLFGGPSPEHDVSIVTGLQAARALAQAGAEPEAVYWSKSGEFFRVDPGLEAEAFLEGRPRGAAELRLVAVPGGGFVGGKAGVLGKERRLEVPAVVNCCHGGPGEDGTLQGALDLAGVAYTGPHAAGASLGMDKLAFAGTVSAAGLPALPRVLVTADGQPPAFDPPFIMKPRFGGSSIGIEVVSEWATAQALAAQGVHYRRGAVVEPYLEGAEDLNVAARSWPALELSCIERPLRTGSGGGAILGYKDKYLGGQGMASAPRELPARIADTLEKSLREAAMALAPVVGLRGVARVDFLVQGDRWWVNEINTIPGSMARYLWVGPAEVAFAALLQDMLTEAARRRTGEWDTTGADGTALRSAGSIASKLA